MTSELAQLPARGSDDIVAGSKRPTPNKRNDLDRFALADRSGPADLAAHGATARERTPMCIRLHGVITSRPPEKARQVPELGGQPLRDATVVWQRPRASQKRAAMASAALQGPWCDES